MASKNPNFSVHPAIWAAALSAVVGLAACSKKEEELAEKPGKAAPEVVQQKQSAASPVPTDLNTLRTAGQKVPVDQWQTLLEKLPSVEDRVELVTLSATMIPQFCAVILRRGMDDASPLVRSEAIHGAQLTYAEAKLSDVLLDGIKDGDPNVRKMALDAIRDLDQQWQIPLYTEALKVSQDEKASYECIQGLGRLNSREGISALLQTAKAISEKSQVAAVQATNLLLKQSFVTVDEANAYWSNNYENYDQNLRPLH